MAHVQFTQPLHAHSHSHSHSHSPSSAPAQPFIHHTSNNSISAPQQTPPSAIRYSQTHAIFQNNMAQYRAPSWAKTYSPHRRTSSDEQISPCHSPFLAPAAAPQPQTPPETPTMSLDSHASTPSPQSSNESLHEMTPQTGPLPPSPSPSPPPPPPRAAPCSQLPQHPSGRGQANRPSPLRLRPRSQVSTRIVSLPARSKATLASVFGFLVKPVANHASVNSWWMTLDAAEQDGIVGTAREVVSSCRYGNGRVLPLMTGSEEIIDQDPDLTRYTRQGPWTSMPFSLISAVGSLIMILRGSDLSSPYAPTAGVRFDGLYKIVQYGCKFDDQSGMHTCGITLRRVPGQAAIEELQRIPRPSQVEDWILYDQLEAMSDSSGRSRGDLMQELSRESSRRPSAASTADSDNSGSSSSATNAESVATPVAAAAQIMPPPPPPPAPAPPPPVMHIYTPMTRPFTTLQQGPSGPMKELPPRLHDVILEDPLAEEFEEMQLSDRRCSSTATSPAYTLSP